MIKNLHEFSVLDLGNAFLKKAIDPVDALDYFLSKSLYKKSKINFQDELFYFKKILDSLDMKTKK